MLHMSIGEPKHPCPAWITEIIARHAADFGRYPPNEGTAELRAEVTNITTCVTLFGDSHGSSWRRLRANTQRLDCAW